MKPTYFICLVVAIFFVHFSIATDKPEKNPGIWLKENAHLLVLLEQLEKEASMDLNSKWHQIKHSPSVQKRMAEIKSEFLKHSCKEDWKNADQSTIDEWKYLQAKVESLTNSLQDLQDEFQSTLEKKYPLLSSLLNKQHEQFEAADDDALLQLYNHLNKAVQEVDSVHIDNAIQNLSEMTKIMEGIHHTTEDHNITNQLKAALTFCRDALRQLFHSNSGLNDADFIKNNAKSKGIPDEMAKSLLALVRRWHKIVQNIVVKSV